MTSDKARSKPSTCPTTRVRRLAQPDLRFIDRLRFHADAAARLDAANVSDSAWFEDFGLGPGGHEHQLPGTLGQPHLSHASLARDAARAELPDDR